MGTQKNWHTIRYGTGEGEIKFGHITQDNQTSAVMLRNGFHPTHYITLDQTGAPHRKHGTICRSPGSFQVRAGDNTPDGQPGVYIEAVSGDLVLRSPSGKVRIEGVDVDIIASGYDGATGIINIDANDKIIMRAQTVDAAATASMKLFTDNTLNMIAKGILNCYGGLIDFGDGACSLKGSKGGSVNEITNTIL